MPRSPAKPQHPQPSGTWTFSATPPATLDEHLGRARERLVAAIGGEAGPEADLPSALIPR